MNFNRKEGGNQCPPLLVGMSQIGRDAQSTFFSSLPETKTLNSPSLTFCNNNPPPINDDDARATRFETLLQRSLASTRQTERRLVRKPFSFSWAMALWTADDSNYAAAARSLCAAAVPSLRSLACLNRAERHRQMVMSSLRSPFFQQTTIRHC